MATPMPTPTSTSVGASVPRATRATPTSATSPAATHLPVLRQRPSGTCVYRTPTSKAAKKVTCGAGSAQPPQLVRSSTSNGRARRAAVATRSYVTMATSCQATSHTIRCRQRRRTTNASNSPACSTNSVHQEPTCARPCQSACSPGACSPPSQRTTASSATAPDPKCLFLNLFMLLVGGLGLGCGRDGGGVPDGGS